MEFNSNFPFSLTDLSNQSSHHSNHQSSSAPSSSTVQHPSQSQQSQLNDRLSRKRSSKACLHCRKIKSKCAKPNNNLDGPCENCVNANVGEFTCLRLGALLISFRMCI